MAAHASSVDTNQLAAALATFRDLSWPVTAAGVAPLINTLGWSATDDDHKIFDVNTGWPINRRRRRSPCTRTGSPASRSA